MDIDEINGLNLEGVQDNDLVKVPRAFMLKTLRNKQAGKEFL